MKNSVEEALERLSTGKKIKMYELLRTFKKEGIENFVITRKKYVDVILSDYKRVLKENEKLKSKIPNLELSVEILMETNEMLTIECDHYEDLIHVLETHYNITEEELEKCMKNDKGGTNDRGRKESC